MFGWFYRPNKQAERWSSDRKVSGNQLHDASVVCIHRKDFITIRLLMHTIIYIPKTTKKKRYQQQRVQYSRKWIQFWFAVFFIVWIEYLIGFYFNMYIRINQKQASKTCRSCDVKNVFWDIRSDGLANPVSFVERRKKKELNIITFIPMIWPLKYIQWQSGLCLMRRKHDKITHTKMLFHNGNSNIIENEKKKKTETIW